MPSSDTYFRKGNKYRFKKGRSYFTWKGKKRLPFSEDWKRKLKENHKGMLGKHLSKEHKIKISKSVSGNKHNNWKGGKSFEPYSVDWTDTLKRSICERDNYICQECSQYGNVIHHIDGDKKNCCPDNLITFCRKCHTKLHRNNSFLFKGK